MPLSGNRRGLLGRGKRRKSSHCGSRNCSLQQVTSRELRHRCGEFSEESVAWVALLKYGTSALITLVLYLTYMRAVGRAGVALRADAQVCAANCLGGDWCVKPPLALRAVCAVTVPDDAQGLRAKRTCGRPLRAAFRALA